MKKILIIPASIMLILSMATNSIASTSNTVLEGKIMKAGTYISNKYMVSPSIISEWNAKLGYVLKITADNAVGLSLIKRKIGKRLRSAAENLVQVTVTGIKTGQRTTVGSRTFDIYQVTSIKDKNNISLYRNNVRTKKKKTRKTIRKIRAKKKKIIRKSRKKINRLSIRETIKIRRQRRKEKRIYRRYFVKARRLYLRAKRRKIDFSAGPCLGKIAKRWVADIVHNPREEIDNLPDNQCKAYSTGEAAHFIELDLRGRFIRAK